MQLILIVILSILSTNSLAQSHHPIENDVMLGLDVKSIGRRNEGKRD